MTRARRLFDYVRLPPEMTEFERKYLARVNRLALWFFWAHVPLMAFVAWVNEMSVWRGVLYTTAVVVGPSIAYARIPDSPRRVSVVLGVTSMFMGALLVHFGQGPMQIEMHFYFFVLLALQSIFANPTVIIVSAITVALHHLILFYLLPSSVFNYDATIWAVLLHALFVVLESVAACFVARSFFDDVIGLDRLVRERTAALDARNRDLQLVLDSVDQGLVTIDLAGRVVGARAAIVDRWLGAPPESGNLCDWLAMGDAQIGQWLRLGLDDLVADVMPREVVLAQLPTTLTLAGRLLRLSYLPADRGAQPRILVVMTEVTASVARAEQERRDREIGMMVERSVRDANGVTEFVEESSRLVARIVDASAQAPERQRALHTLKGNAGAFGLTSIASLCDDVETALAAGAVSLDTACHDVERGWTGLRERLDPVLGHEAANVRVSPAELLAVAEQVHRWSPELARRILEWPRDPLDLRLSRLAGQAEQVASRLGKQAPRVEVRADGLRLPRHRYAALWQSLAHAVRNAVDHGIETAEERTSGGKPARSTLILSAHRRGSVLEVCVSDDGRGIDWARVAVAASRHGLAVPTHADVERALFLDGISTREEPTEISGRGIGMAALREAARTLGGDVEVESSLGRGTTVRVRVLLPDADFQRELVSARRSLIPDAA